MQHTAKKREKEKEGRRGKKDNNKQQRMNSAVRSRTLRILLLTSKVHQDKATLIVA